jgi:hypothetical protein
VHFFLEKLNLLQAEKNISARLNFLQNLNYNVFPDKGQISSEVDENNSKTILFVGTLTYKPNRLGIEYFITSILPHILDQDPSVKFQVETFARWTFISPTIAQR